MSELATAGLQSYSNSELESLQCVTVITLTWHLVIAQTITHSMVKGRPKLECGMYRTQFRVDMSRRSPVSVWTEGHTVLGGHITMTGNYLASWQCVNNLPWPKGLASTLGIHNVSLLWSCMALQEVARWGLGQHRAKNENHQVCY